MSISTDEEEITKKALTKALEHAIAQVDALKEAIRYFLPDGFDIDYTDPPYYPQWPGEVKTIYFMGDPSRAEKCPEFRTGYLRFMAFLETCANREAIVYRRVPGYFSWAVLDETVYRELCDEFGYSEEDFDPWDRDSWNKSPYR